MADGSIMATAAARISAADIIADWKLPPYLAQAVRALELSGRRDEGDAQRVIWLRRAWAELFHQAFQPPPPRWNVTTSRLAADAALSWGLDGGPALALQHIERAASAGNPELFREAVGAAEKAVAEVLG